MLIAFWVVGKGAGPHLAFDQEGEVMVLLTSCFVSAQAQSPGSVSSSLFLTGFLLRHTYLHPGLRGVGSKCALWYTPHDRLQNGNNI